MAHWPGGAARRGGLGVPDTDLRVNLHGTRAKQVPMAFDGDRRLEEVVGSEIATGVVGWVLLVAAAFDGFSSAVWAASFYGDAPLWLIGSAAVLFAAGVAARRGVAVAAVGGAVFLGLDMAWWILINAGTGTSLWGPFLRLVLFVVAAWWAWRVVVHAIREHRLFPGPSVDASVAADGAPVAPDATNPYDAPGR